MFFPDGLVRYIIYEQPIRCHHYLEMSHHFRNASSTHKRNQMKFVLHWFSFQLAHQVTHLYIIIAQLSCQAKHYDVPKILFSPKGKTHFFKSWIMGIFVKWALLLLLNVHYEYNNNCLLSKEAEMPTPCPLFSIVLLGTQWYMTQIPPPLASVSSIISYYASLRGYWRGYIDIVKLPPAATNVEYFR